MGPSRYRTAMGTVGTAPWPHLGPRKVLYQWLCTAMRKNTYPIAVPPKGRKCSASVVCDFLGLETLHVRAKEGMRSFSCNNQQRLKNPIDYPISTPGYTSLGNPSKRAGSYPCPTRITVPSKDEGLLRVHPVHDRSSRRSEVDGGSERTGLPIHIEWSWVLVVFMKQNESNCRLLIINELPL